jgi:hypothetical protein
LLHTDEVHQLAQRAGLRIDKLELFSNSLTNGHMKLNHMLRILPRGLVDSIEKLTHRLPAVLANRLMVQMAARLQRPCAITHAPVASAA